MIDIKIPSEIRGFQVKTFGPFTTRQAICFLIASGGAVATYAAEKYLLGSSEPPLFPLLIPAIPPIFMGWGESFLRMLPEDYIRYVWLPNKKRTESRKYVTDNYNPLVKEYKKYKKKETLAKKEEEEKGKKKKKEVKVKIPKELEADLTIF